MSRDLTLDVYAPLAYTELYAVRRAQNSVNLTRVVEVGFAKREDKCNNMFSFPRSRMCGTRMSRINCLHSLFMPSNVHKKIP